MRQKSQTNRDIKIIIFIDRLICRYVYIAISNKRSRYTGVLTEQSDSRHL